MIVWRSDTVITFHTMARKVVAGHQPHHPGLVGDGDKHIAQGAPPSTRKSEAPGPSQVLTRDAARLPRHRRRGR